MTSTSKRSFWVSVGDGVGLGAIFLFIFLGLSALVYSCNQGDGSFQLRVARTRCLEHCGKPAPAECVEACMCSPAPVEEPAP